MLFCVVLTRWMCGQRTACFSKLALKKKILTLTITIHTSCSRSVWVKLYMCVWLHASSAWMLLHSTATDVSCQRAATWVSDLSLCGVALFDDKRVLKTLSSLWGDQLLYRCSNTASNLSQTVAEAVKGWCFSSNSHFISFYPPHPLFSIWMVWPFVLS